MDLLKRMQLRKSSLSLSYDTLDDTVLEKIVNEHSHHLQQGSKLVLAFVTNMARIFLVDSTLEVMLVDLKANNGGDYFMYDYEFETDDEEDPNDNQLGYLIIEVVKENGDLYFLQQVVNRHQEPEVIKVLDKAGNDAAIGKEHGWIDCLLIARETSTASPVDFQPSNDASAVGTTAASSVAASAAKTTKRASSSSTKTTNGGSSNLIIKTSSNIKSAYGSGKKSKKEIIRKTSSLSLLRSSSSSNNQATNFARAAAAAARPK